MSDPEVGGSNPPPAIQRILEKSLTKKEEEKMELLQAVILGTIQGIAEWLPISSEGMVTLAGQIFFGMDFGRSLGNAIWLHAGTMVAAVIYFRKDLQNLFTPKNRELLWFVVWATAATGVVAVPLLLLAFSFEIPAWISTVVIGCFLLMVSFLNRRQKDKGSHLPDTKSGLITGAVQGISALPGMSRSGLTVAALVAQKFSLEQAFRLSFLISIPAVLGAQLVLPIIQGEFAVTVPMIAGGLVSALVGLVAISSLMKFAKGTDFSKATFFLGLIVILAGLLMAF